MKNLGFIFLFSVLSFIACDSADNCICTEEYAPVCGDNGKEYPNACHASCDNQDFTIGFCTREDSLMVRYTGDVSVDGCGYLLEHDNQSYHADNLDSTLMEDSLYIYAKYQPLFDYFTCGLGAEQYQKVEIDTAWAL